MKKRILFFFVLLTAFSKIQSQDKIKKADMLYDNYAYIDAIKIYEKVAQMGYKSAALFEKLGNSYYFNGDFDKANIWYKALFDLNEKIDTEYFYRYSQTLKSIGNYQKADQILSEFIKFNSKDLRGRLYSENRDYLVSIKEGSGRYTIEKLSINSEFSDFGGSLNGDNLVFTSNRKSMFSGNVSDWTNQGFTKLYVSIIGTDGSLSTPKKISYSKENKFNESTAVFTKDGKTMYFTANRTEKLKTQKNINKVTRLKIFKAILKNGEWQNIIDLSINSDNFSNAHPALSADEKTLYFASDRPGSKGESDIYKVEIKNNGILGVPVNLGNNINTEGKETFPSLSGEDELYFSSDGHPGLGGLDVFVSKLSDGGYQKAHNLGEPINSPMDDFGFVIDPVSKIGYFSSNRKGGIGFDDIYKLKEIQEQKSEQLLRGIITDSQSANMLYDAKVLLFDQDMKLTDEVNTDQNGIYNFDHLIGGKSYSLRVEKEGYLTKENIIILPKEAGTTNFSVVLDKATVKVGEGSDLAKALDNIIIHFDLDKSIIRPDAEVQLAVIVEVMQEYPTMRIDVRSYTDSRASKNHNLELSDARAKATIKWMIEHGIDAGRVAGKGFGESKLLNGCGDGVKCTEEEHKLNRRSEFIIMKI